MWKLFRDNARFDVTHNERKTVCREAGKDEEYNYHHIDRSKKKRGGKNCFCIESKNIFIENKVETNPFEKCSYFS